MEKPITVAVAILGTVLALMLPRRYAIVPLALSLCMYPNNLNLPPENLGLNPQRIIGFFLLCRCLFARPIRAHFKWGGVDTAAAIYFVLLFASQLISQGINQALVNRGGFFLSALVPFWCVRFLITDREALYSMLKGFLWGALPLAIGGWWFMTRGYSPYYALMENGPFFTDTGATAPNAFKMMRTFMGVLCYRAHAPFLQCIMFGWFFALLMVPMTNLFWEKRGLLPWIIGFAFLPLGLVSAVAGGPMMFAAFSFGLLALFPFRRYGMSMLWVGVVLYVALSVFANRSPMELLASMGMDPVSSWYRIGLQNQVMRGGMFGGHWIYGFGEVPASFGYFHDLCIHWIAVLAFNGIMGMVGFYGLIAMCFVALWKAKKRAASVEDQWLLWSLMATLLGSLLAMMVVALFSEMYFIYHMFLALCANAPVIVGGATRQVAVLAHVQGQQVLLRYTLKAGQRLAIIHPPGTSTPPAQK